MATELGSSMGILLSFLAAHPEVLLAISSFLFLGFLRHRVKGTCIIYYPILGMLPSILLNFHRVHEFLTSVLVEKGCTVWIRGPWLYGMEIISSCDPAVAKYVSSTKFNNYVRGPRFREVLEPPCDGVICADYDEWCVQRRVALDFMHQPKFLRSLRRMTRHMVERRLLPILDHAAAQPGEKKNVLDLQGALQRLNFDIMCSLTLGVDLGSLSVSLPKLPLATAINDAEEAILFRYVVPPRWWRLLTWLHIGPEKKLAEAMKVIDEFVYQLIASKKEELGRRNGDVENHDGEADAPFDLLTEFIKKSVVDGTGGIFESPKSLRDTAFEFLLAGWHSIGVATAWLLWLVSTNPSVEAKILDELVRAHDACRPLQQGQQRGYAAFDAEELDGCVYLNAAIRESLRLFAPIPLNPKHAHHHDVLPTGEKLKPGTVVLLSLYAMGRMEKNWGEDATEYKPERWISEKGQLREESSYKLGAFGSGPSMCPGKHLALATIKAVAASIIYNFSFTVAEGHEASPRPTSVILHMKKGLKGALAKRETEGGVLK